MKKILFPIIGIIAISMGLIGWQKVSYSQSNLPYPQPQNKPNLSACTQSVANEVSLMRNAWYGALDEIRAQEKPSSEMVDEAFESMRTYRCWLDYLCESVLFSSVHLDEAKRQYWKDFNANASMRLTDEHVDNISGCVDADDVEIPGTKLKFMEYCAVDPSVEQTVSVIQTNFHICRQLVEKEFAPLGDKGSESSEVVDQFKKESSAFLAVEKMLKENSVRQKSRALTSKLQNILNKMYAMESDMELLKQKVFKFDALLSCFISKCN